MCRMVALVVCRLRVKGARGAAKAAEVPAEKAAEMHAEKAAAARAAARAAAAARTELQAGSARPWLPPSSWPPP